MPRIDSIFFLQYVGKKYMTLQTNIEYNYPLGCMRILNNLSGQNYDMILLIGSRSNI